MIYLQSLVVLVYFAIYRIGNNGDNGLSSYVKPELITPDKFSMRGNIKNHFCEEKYGMYFAETIYGGKGFRWTFSRGWVDIFLIYVITCVKL